jgi:YD repeat-containing protein
MRPGVLGRKNATAFLSVRGSLRKDRPVSGFFIVFLAVGLLVSAVSHSVAQETRYIYDAAGQLIGVVTPDGTLTTYEYDEVGNLLAVRRPGSTGPVTVTFVHPGIGTAGTRVEIFGNGFSHVIGENHVVFNDVPALVLEASPTLLIAEVPAGATSGALTITTPLGSTSAPEPFRVPHLTLSPAHATVPVRALRQFRAVVGETTDQRANWSVNGVPGGNALLGTIALDGLYRAPAESPIPPTVRVRATSVPFPALYAEVDIFVLPAPWNAIVATPGDIRVVRPGTGDPGGLPLNIAVARPPDVRMVRPGTGDPDGLPLNITVARPSGVTTVRPGTGDPDGVPLNMTVAQPPHVSAVRPGTGDPDGLRLNMTVAIPPLVTLVRPGTGDPGGLAFNLTVAVPPVISVVRPGTGDPGGSPVTTIVAQPHEIHVERP